jgi:hypothetical protein
MKKDHMLYVVSVFAGAAVWIAVSKIAGRQEAWDSGEYFFVGMPTLCALAGVLGYVEPKRIWRWAALPMAGQAVWLLLSQGFGNLMPLGIIVFVFLALPLLLFARIGAAFARARVDETSP